MMKARDLWLIFLQVAIYGIFTSCEPLMGPYKCPADGKCVETNSCPTGYYVTSNGWPYHCGPRYHMDSMICCHDPETTTEVVPSTTTYGEELSLLQSGNLASNGGDDDESSSYIHLNSKSSESQLNAEDDDHQELTLPDLPQDGKDDEKEIFQRDNIIHFNVFQDEGSSGEQFHETETYVNHQDSVNELRDIPPEKSYQQPTMQRPQQGKAIDEDIHLKNYGRHKPSQIFPQQPHLNLDNELPSIEKSRRYSRQGIYDACFCDKGDKGDQGPPGEPGKIIYVPVFISSPNTNPPHSHNFQPQPQQFYQQPQQQRQPIQQDYMFSYPNPQQYDSNYPSHPNPTIVPYSIPITPTVSGPHNIPMTRGYHQPGQPLVQDPRHAYGYGNSITRK